MYSQQMKSMKIILFISKALAFVFFSFKSVSVSQLVFLETEMIKRSFKCKFKKNILLQ